MKVENEKLKATIDSLNTSNADNTKLVNELKQLKELLDAKIITQEDFDKKKDGHHGKVEIKNYSFDMGNMLN